MNVPVAYLFSSATGDIPVLPQDLERPFILSPGKEHPFLTLGDYLGAIKTFLLEQKNRLKPFLPLGDLRIIKIRSEKHGALYHIASAEFESGQGTGKICITTAVSDRGKAVLAREFEVLRKLGSSIKLLLIPRVYEWGERGEFSMCLSEWLENYHEWHLAEGEETGVGERVLIWDLQRGNRYASEEEHREIFRQTALILTLYYDIETFEQIRLWHHAAGDFVVRSEGETHVKLTTVRDYKPLGIFPSREGVDPKLAAVFFFMNLAVRIRLDKEEGMGKILWADKFALKAAVEGFFQALEVKQTEGKHALGSVDDFLLLLQDFEGEELQRLYDPLLDLYRQEEPEDLSTIEHHLPVHVAELRQALRDFHV